MKAHAGRRALWVLLAIGTGCASSSSGTSSPPKPALSGQYTATSAGPIAEVTFADSSYVLWTSPCSDGSGRATCMEQGAFAVNDTLTELTLTNGATGESRTLPMQVLAVEAAGPSETTTTTGSAPSSEPSGTQSSESSEAAPNVSIQDGLVAGDGGPLAGGEEGGLTGTGTPLQAQLAPTPVKLVSTSNQVLAKTGPKPACAFDNTFQGTADMLVAKLKGAVLKAAKTDPLNTFDGDTTQGTIEAHGCRGFCGSVGSTYRISGQNIHIEITHKPGGLEGLVVTCGKIEQNITQAVACVPCTASEFCVGTGKAISCQPLPSACQSNATCACLKSANVCSVKSCDGSDTDMFLQCNGR